MTICGWSWMKALRNNDALRRSTQTQRHKYTERNASFHFALCLCASVSLCSLLIAPTVLAERSGPFIIGADISWTLEDEAAGAKFFDKGEQKDLLAILKDHGFNYIRL